MKKFSVFFLVLVFMSSCASIFKGSKQTVSIDSNVRGAEVLVDGEKLGETPFVGKIKRGSSTSITVKKEGYQSKTIVADTGIEPAFWFNIFSGSLSSTTDLATGAMYKYTPTALNIDLNKVENNQEVNKEGK